MSDTELTMKEILDCAEIMPIGNCPCDDDTECSSCVVQRGVVQMANTITRLTAELAEAREFINSKFDPVFALNVKMADELATARADAARLREDLQEAIHRLGDMYDDDDGQAWKEAMKFLNRMDELTASEKGMNDE